MARARPGGGRRRAIITALPVCALAAAIAFLGFSDASAGTLAGSEIDADSPVVEAALFAQSASDWAENGSSAAEGVFLLGTGGAPDFIGCFGSDLSVNPASSGTAGFICDGSSDSRFDGNGGDTVVEPELNIVSPGGKQIQDIWAIKEGSVTAKDDFSHAYNVFRSSDSSCDSDADAG